MIRDKKMNPTEKLATAEPNESIEETEYFINNTTDLSEIDDALPSSDEHETE
jgi:hypothetical protein